MTAMKIPPPALAVLAIGALWYLSQRRALGGTVTGNPAYGTQGALGNGAVRLFGVSPSGVIPATSNPITAALGAISSIFGRTPASVPPAAAMGIDQLAAAYGQGGPSAGYYASTTNPAYRAAGEIVRPADYVPSYNPDTQGEAAAQSYYLSNPDEFISNPPPILAYSDGNVGSTGGWADQQ